MAGSLDLMVPQPEVSLGASTIRLGLDFLEQIFLNRIWYMLGRRSLKIGGIWIQRQCSLHPIREILRVD